MAGLGGKNWSFQEEVTSSDVNGFLADQVVMRFANAATRTAGFGGAGEPTLAEGMVSYLDDTNSLEVYNGSSWQSVSKPQAGQVIQVVSTQTATQSTTTSTAYSDVPNLSVSITPSSASSKVLIIASVHTSHSTDTGGFLRLLRDSTVIGTDPQVWFYNGSANTQFSGQANSISYLDSPSTTSAITYKIQYRKETGAGVAVNRSWAGIAGQVAASTITAMEIAG